MNYVENWIKILKIIDKCRFLGFDGYSISKVLTIPTKEVVIGERKCPPFFKVVRQVLVDVFSDGYSYDFSSIKDCHVVLFYSHLHAQRADYVRFMETVASTTDNAMLFTGSVLKGREKKIHFDLCSLKTIPLCISWLLTLKRNKIERKYYSTYLIDLVQMYRWKNILLKNIGYISTIKSMVSIFDAREYENIFTQFCNSQGIVTATLQHGHFGKRGYLNSISYYLDIAYAGFVSDYFLAWGQYSKENAIEAGVESGRIVKCGCPDFINPVPVECKGVDVGVLFDGDINAKEDNLEMLRIALELLEKEDSKVKVKLHPSDSIDNYRNRINAEKVELFVGSIREFAEQVSFVICCNTSALIQLLAIGVDVFRYKTTLRYDMYTALDDFSFVDSEGLMSVMKNNEEYKDKLSLLSEAVGVKSKYNMVLDNLYGYCKYTN